ncbi:hypothetical protein L6164_025073 [Bauhinia variegata]|uniref:Uncharacterized protein n=1 Tax=Bauhinia variegata TaxID=167791 RepID=A0ACB9M2I3_BAUVA|nr:hypothetical protein L6164_025073 [Bauhinia variegata]
MASNSIAIFSFYSQTHFLSSKSVCNRLQNPKSRGLRRLNHRLDKRLSISVQATKFRSSLKIQSSSLWTEFCCSKAPRTPSPNFPSVNSSISRQKILFRFLSVKLVFFLIGSFIFIGFFNKRAALALPSGISNGVSEEEKMEAVEGKSEEEEMYEKLLEKDSSSVEDLKVILYEKIRRGKSREAVKYVENLIDVEPDEVEWRLLLALCHETMGNLGKAKRVYGEILEERPLLIRALHGLAMVMHKNHEGPVVFEMLHKARELAFREKKVTEERNIRILIAQMHVVKGGLDEGLKQFQDLVEENPRDFRPYLCQGIIYTLQDKKEEAAEQFETYRSLVPEEFPQKSFLDDVVLTAKETPRE